METAKILWDALIEVVKAICRMFKAFYIDSITPLFDNISLIQKVTGIIAIAIAGGGTYLIRKLIKKL